MNRQKYLAYFKSAEKLTHDLHGVTKIPLIALERVDYSFGEFTIINPSDVTNGEVFLVIQISGNTSERFVELALAIDVLKRSGAAVVNLIIPYLPFSRQDKQVSDHRSVASQVFANMLSRSGINKLYTFDLHNEKIIDYYKIPVVHLSMLDTFIKYCQTLPLKDLVVVAPDYGRFNAAKYVQTFFKEASFVVINKRRDEHNEVQIDSISGNTKGKVALIIEDIIDTGNTLVAAVNELRKHGVEKVYVAATHGVFSGDSIERLTALNIDKVIVSNSIPQYRANDLVIELPINEVLIKSLLSDS